MHWISAEAHQRYDAFAASAGSSIAAFDLDGTLSPIVDDPAEATIHPDAGEALLELAGSVRALAVITGRPARQALELGDLERLGDRVAELDRELHVLGQYGNERWSSSRQEIISPRPPRGLSSFESELPTLLSRHDAADAWVEEKGLAVAVHTRRLPDPQEALDRITGPISEAAERHGLILEPGRNVLEVRAEGMDKGQAVRTLVDELEAEGFLFCGDDLGDLEAFRAVDELRADGLSGLLVCSRSEEQNALRELADITVPGPDGVLDLVRMLAADLRGG